MVCARCSRKRSTPPSPKGSRRASTSPISGGYWECDRGHVAIRLTLALTFFNFLGANAARVLLTLYALELDAPASAVGVIGGVLYLLRLLVSWPIGAVADRRGSPGA